MKVEEYFPGVVEIAKQMWAYMGKWLNIRNLFRGFWSAWLKKWFYISVDELKDISTLGVQPMVQANEERLFVLWKSSTIQA